MSWVPFQPLRSDFCGSPPCPLCFGWVDPQLPDASPISGIEKMAFDLLQKPLADASDKDRKALQTAAQTIHHNNLANKKVPVEPLAPVDIGLSPTVRLNAFVRGLRPVRTDPKPVQQLTCDAIADRQVERDAEKRRRDEAREERRAEIKEIAAEFKAVQEGDKKSQERKSSSDEERMLAEIEVDAVVDPAFICHCQINLGITDPREILARARATGAFIKKQYDNPNYYDPRKPSNDFRYL